MTSKIKKSNNVSIFGYLILIALSVLFLFPIIWLLLSSFKGYIELFKYPPTLLPESFSPINYIDAFEKGNWLRYFGNTATVTVLSTILCVTISVMGGYAFAKYKFKGDNSQWQRLEFTK